MFTTLISTAELAARLDDPLFVVVDVRHDLMHPDAWGEEEYGHEHVPGARFAHLDRDLSAPKTGTNGRHPLPSPDACAALFGRLGIDATKQVVAYDQNAGMFASRLWWMLRWLGHEAVAVLDGGWDKWMRERRPSTADVPGRCPATFTIRGVGRTIRTGDVQQGLLAGSMLLIDARSPERFRGDVEPFDPVAGRIPGAVNRPFGKNMNADATFRAAGELETEFGRLLGERSRDSVVHMCGSGVTACHNILAMEVAGLSGTLHYPGSWSEWCADPARPVARGADQG